MKILKLISVLWILIITSYSFSQSISGSVKFQSDRTDYTWTFVEVDGVKTECDSLGEFELNNINVNDTLEIIPIPIFINVKIYNFPKNFDSLIFNSIPLFNNVNYSTPIINFRTKRASKKYFKKFTKEKQLERDELINRIENYSYTWSGQEYKLEVIESKESLILLIDLKNK